MADIVGYETFDRVYCLKCARILGVNTNKPIFAGSEVDVIPACAECGDDIEGLEEIEEEEEE